MSSNNSSSNRINVPEAKQAMDQFKMQAANDMGINFGKECWPRRCVL